MAKTEPSVDLYYSGAWHDITAIDGVYTRDPITITRKTDPATRTPPSSLSLTLNNRDGRYSPRNPVSPLYRLVGRNTPIRVVTGRVMDTFTRTESSGWGTSDSGHAWSTSGGAAGDYAVASGKGTHTHTAVDTAHLTATAVVLADVDAYAEITVPVTATGGGIIANLTARHTDADNHYRVELNHDTAGTIDLSIWVRTGGVSTQLAVSNNLLAYTPGTATKVRFQVAGTTLRARIWAGASEPSTWDLTVSDDTFSTGAVGTRSSLSSANTNTLPLAVSFDNYDTFNPRYYGEVESWPSRWTVDGRDVWTSIAANGILLRLGSTGTQRPVYSALHRFIAANAPYAWWPLEVSAAAAALTPTSDLASTYTSIEASTSYGKAVLADWLPAGLEVSGVVALRATPPAGPSPTTVAVDILHRGHDVQSTSAFTSLGLWAAAEASGDTYEYYVFMNWNAGVPELELYREVSGSAPTLIDSATAAEAEAGWDDAMHHWRLQAVQNGADVDVTVYLDGAAVMSGTHTSATLRLPKLNITNFDVDRSGWSQGVMWVGTVPSVTSTVDAATGHVGELAADRVERLCGEDDITVTVLGDPDLSEPLGVQRLAPVLDLLDDATQADGGILYESRWYLGLAYRTRESLYNQTATVEADYAAGGEVAPPLDPTEDTDHVGNDVTVTRYLGGSGRAVQESGPLNVADPTTDPDGVGRYIKDATLVLATDGQLPNQAQWRRHLGTWDEARYPVVHLDLTAMVADGKTALAGQAASLDVGDRFTITSPPSGWVAPDDILQHAQGFVETLASHRWDIHVNATPAGPYKVLVWQDLATEPDPDAPARFGADLSVTAAEFVTGTDTALYVDPAGGPYWTTAAADLPFDVELSGARLRATAIAEAVRDSFTRTATSGWDTAESGQAWSTSGGSASDYSVASGKGRVSHAAVNTQHFTTVAVDLEDVDIYAEITVPVTATGGSIFAAITARLADSDNHYRCELGHDTAGTIDLIIYRRVGGAAAEALATSNNLESYTPGARTKVRFQVIGTALRARIWAGDDEPATWDLETTDSSFASGAVGTRTSLSSANSNTLPLVIDFDAVQVPHLVTVNQAAVNGVAKTVPAGEPVRLWRPSVWAL